MAVINILQMHRKFRPWSFVPSPAAASNVNLCESQPRSSSHLLRLPFQPLWSSSFNTYLTPLPATGAREVRPQALSKTRALDSAQASPLSPSSSVSTFSPEEGQNEEGG